jgi:hypothetical protein
VGGCDHITSAVICWFAERYLESLRFWCDFFDILELDFLDFPESLNTLDRILLFELWCDESGDAEEVERLLSEKEESESELKSVLEVDESD